MTTSSSIPNVHHRTIAEVVAKVPDRYMKSGVVELFGREMGCFLEGPAFDVDGGLLMVDIPWGRVFRMSPDLTFEVIAEYDGWPGGLALDNEGRTAFIADHKNGIVTLDLQTGEIAFPLRTYNGERFRGCSDLCITTGGDVYFTDQGQTGLQNPVGRVFRLRPGGELDLVLGGIPSPNGIVVNDEETVALVAVTRANSVWRVPLIGSGVGKVSNFIQLSGGLSGPDGLALDAEGGVSVAHAGRGIVWRFDRLGELTHEIRSPVGPMVTNAAYGGKDGRDLYAVDEEGYVLRAPMPFAGQLVGPARAAGHQPHADRQ